MKKNPFDKMFTEKPKQIHYDGVMVALHENNKLLKVLAYIVLFWSLMIPIFLLALYWFIKTFHPFQFWFGG